MRWAGLTGAGSGRLGVPVVGVMVGAVLLLVGVIRADTVLLTDNTRINNCKVVGESAREVRIDLDNDGAPDRTIPSEKVADIRYADRSLEYRQAELFLKSGKYDLAAKSFARIASRAEADSWVAVYADYYRAQALLKWAETEPGKADQAVKALSDFLERHPDSRFVYPARLRLAEAYLLRRRLAEARRLAERVVKEKPGTRWAMRAQVLEARARLSAGEAASAAAAFQRVLANLKDPNDPLRAEAVIGKGRALLAQGKLEEGERLLRSLIETTTSGLVRARAYNALGEAYFRKGDYAAARLCYLRVVLLYFRESPAEHAKALYFAGECFRRLGQGKRAEELFRQLLRRYPGTPWADRVPVNVREEGD